MNGSRKCDIYIIYNILEFYSAIRKNEPMWFEDRWMELDKLDSERQSAHVFSQMWKIDPKHKRIKKQR
jgi:hypothetical protein